jgi:pilus assembly protein CpaB
MNRRRGVGVGAAVVLAGVGSLGVVSWANSSKSRAEAQVAQTAVVIIDNRVPKGADAATIKAASHVGTVQQKSLADGALTSENQIGTQVAAADLEPGDQLVQARLTANTSGAPADKVQVSANLSAERAVGGQLKAGDTVGVYISFEPTHGGSSEAAPTPAPPASTTDLEFQHVLVTNVQTTSAPASQKSGNQVQQVSGDNFVVTLALSPAQSERFVFGGEFGHIWLSNEPATVKDDGTGIITMGNVYSVVP